MRVYTKKQEHRPTEEYKAVRTNLLHVLKDEKNRVLVFTSSHAHVNLEEAVMRLAREFSRSGNRVLVVDCNMRKTGKDTEKGLGGYLTGEEKAFSFQEKKGVSFLPAGREADSAELLGSGRMAELVGKFSGEYDYVFLLTASVRDFTDCSVLSHLSHGIVLVEKRDVSNYTGLDEAVEKIALVEGNILGILFTSTPVKLFGLRFVF